MLAIEIHNGLILAVGEEARTALKQIEDMRANPPLKHDVPVKPSLTKEDVIVGSPFRNGTIADFDWASKMLTYFVYKVNGRHLLKRPRIAVCAPADMTQVEHKALYELFLAIGAKSVLILEEPFEKAISDIPLTYKVIIEITPETESYSLTI